MTITEVCEKYDMTPDTLRYYERIGLIPRVPRTSGGKRDYDETSCSWIQMMKCMRKAGVEIEALIDYVDLYHQGNETVDERKKILMDQRERLLERMNDMRNSLDLLNHKIELYDQGKMMK